MDYKVLTGNQFHRLQKTLPNGGCLSLNQHCSALTDHARASLYDRLFEYLLPLWTVMFPSSRILPPFPPDSLESIQVSLVTDGFDQHIWRFLAGFALEGTQEQHSRLVTQLRAKVMGTLKMAQSLEEGKAKARKIRNVDLFLNALGLSSSQIPVQ